SELQVNSYTFGVNSYATLAMDTDGDFVVAWASSFQESGGGVFGRRFASAGVPQATEFHVNSYVTDTQSFPQIAPQGGGAFVAVWSSYGQDGDSFGVFGVRFSSAGAALASEFQVRSYTA